LLSAHSFIHRYARVVDVSSFFTMAKRQLRCSNSGNLIVVSLHPCDLCAKHLSFFFLFGEAPLKGRSPFGCLWESHTLQAPDHYGLEEPSTVRCAGLDANR
jgi:hypothetical protein